MQNRISGVNLRFGGALPMENTAQTLNRRLGLYLSQGQQQALAIGIFMGAVAASAVLAWGAAEAVRRSRR